MFSQSVVSIPDLILMRHHTPWNQNFYFNRLDEPCSVSFHRSRTLNLSTFDISFLSA
jgi:hypothetical protein